MTQTPQHPAQSSPRLIRLLSELTPAPITVTDPDIPEQLAQLFDFSSSISLSRAYGQLPALSFEPGNATSASLRAQFLSVRATLVSSVVASFDPDSEASRFKLPVPIDPDSVAGASACEPYQKFYIAHQRQFDLSIQALRAQVSKGAAGLSPELAQTRRPGCDDRPESYQPCS